jgi:hypothetical protein
MKTPQIVITLIIMLFTSNILNADNRDKGFKENPTDLMVEKIGNDVVLTRDQKNKISQKIEIYRKKVLEANKIQNREDLIAAKKDIFKDYSMAIDSILTNDQKIQRAAKQNERRENVRKKIHQN